MSYIYSQALVEEYLPAICLDTDASVQSSWNHTPKQCLWHDKTMEVSRHSRFGMMCKPLTENHGAELLTLLLEDFRARTYQLQDEAPVSLEQSQECGLTWRASLAKFNQSSSTWKTVQLCLLGESELFSVTWPRSGMTQNGECWELPTLEHRTSVTEFGYTLPTPSASDTSDRKVPDGFHTTKTGQFKHVSPTGEKSQMRLSQAVKIRGARHWPTPLARDSRTVRGGSRSMNALGTEPLITQVAESEGKTDGRLNPEWVEWLMGWPSGWTDLKPLETAKFQEWQQQHGVCSADDKGVM
jgi:hypothetical protein